MTIFLIFFSQALEFGASTLMNVNLRSILSLSSEKPVKVDIQLDGAYWAVKSVPSSKSRKDVASNVSNDTILYLDLKPIIPLQPGRLHADGYLSFETPHAVPPLDIVAVRNRCPGHIGSGKFSFPLFADVIYNDNCQGFYPSLSYFSAYGTHFQRVTNVYYSTNEALASIKGSDAFLAK